MDPDALTPSLARAARQHLLDPQALATAQARHAAAWKRARRQRNLAAHGHRLDDPTLLATVKFLAEQLEIAITAHADQADGRSATWLGSIATAPDDQRAGTTLSDVLDAVRSGH